MNNTNMPSADRLPPPIPSFLGLILGLLMPLLLVTQPTLAQDSESGPDKQQKARHYSLYYESFKNDNFESAKDDLEWIIENAPGFPKGDDRNFWRQVQLYRGLAENAANDEDRRAYLDTAATLLANAPEKMKEHELSFEEFKWEIRKGRFLQQHGDSLSDLEAFDSLSDPYTHYRKAFELAPKEVNAYYIRQALESYVNANEQEQALAFMAEVEAKRGDDEEVSEIVSSMREDIFGKNPQARINYLEEEMEANPDSAEIMQSLFDAYVQRDNISKASDLAPRLMETNPPAETVRQIAEMRLDDGRPEEALEAYDQAEEQGAELQAQDYFNRGEAYKEMDNFSRARREYQQAIDLQEDFGEAYLAIGDLYARAVNECSGGSLGRKDKAVYWAAVDKYQEAIQADPSVESSAQRQIKSYQRVFPTQEDIFYREDWQEGESFTIDYGCYSWINETTTVRPAP